MSIKEFGETIQSEVFKKWLSKLDKNIVNATVSDIRKKEQIAAKTDFILSVKDVKNMYKAVTSKEISSSIARRVLRNIAAAGKLDIPAKVLRVGGSGALLFQSIGFDTISKYVTAVFDNLDGVQEAYEQARETYLNSRLEKIKADKSLITGAQKQRAIDAAEKTARDIGFGYFLHKGHVVSLATNSAKNFRQSIEDANQFTEGQKSLLISVLDKYITKLEKDDLASANLPNAYKQEIYAKYIKSSSKYLVEIQLKSDNLESGSASLPITNELRKVFSASSKELTDLMASSPALGQKLVSTKGSPSMVDLIILDLVTTLKTGKPNSKKYSLGNTKISSRSKKVTKKNNKAEVQKLKLLKTKVKAIPKLKAAPDAAFEEVPVTNLISLQMLLAANLAERIKANMGEGSAKDVLNLRSGRLADSAKIVKLSESRAGMITAFYTYMKNPYATFSQGGKQQYPRSRDPKLLISKSIREIAEQQVANRLRAVLV